MKNAALAAVAVVLVIAAVVFAPSNRPQPRAPKQQAGLCPVLCAPPTVTPAGLCCAEPASPHVQRF